jgi:hypothetical protein
MRLSIIGKDRSTIATNQISALSELNSKPSRTLTIASLRRVHKRFHMMIEMYLFHRQTAHPYTCLVVETTIGRYLKKKKKKKKSKGKNASSFHQQTQRSKNVIQRIKLHLTQRLHRISTDNTNHNEEQRRSNHH